MLIVLRWDMFHGSGLCPTFLKHHRFKKKPRIPCERLRLSVSNSLLPTTYILCLLIYRLLSSGFFVLVIFLLPTWDIIIIIKVCIKSNNERKYSMLYYFLINKYTIYLFIDWVIVVFQSGFPLIFFMHIHDSIYMFRSEFMNLIGSYNPCYAAPIYNLVTPTPILPQFGCKQSICFHCGLVNFPILDCSDSWFYSYFNPVKNHIRVFFTWYNQEL